MQLKKFRRLGQYLDTSPSLSYPRLKYWIIPVGRHWNTRIISALIYGFSFQWLMKGMPLAESLIHAWSGATPTLVNLSLSSHGRGPFIYLFISERRRWPLTLDLAEGGSPSISAAFLPKSGGKMSGDDTQTSGVTRCQVAPRDKELHSLGNKKKTRPLSSI